MMFKDAFFQNLQSIARIVIALIFIIISFDKLMNLDIVYLVVAKKEFFFSKQFIIIGYSLLELIFGLFLLVGYKIRMASFALAFLHLFLTLSMHHFWSMIVVGKKIIHLQFFLKNLVVIMALFYIASSPSDKLSLDRAYEVLAENNKKRKKK